MTTRQRPVPDGLVEAFWEYERALMADDVATLDRLFAPGPTTLRGDADGLLVGHDQISAFRSSRGGTPQRRIVQTHVQTVDDDHALVVAVTELARGGRGQQTQLWVRTADGWRVTAAHVSAPGPALDTRIWRLVGDPLVPAIGPGPLDGETVAVKDVYAVRGERIGAGNPAWLAEAREEPVHARAVELLLEAGASLRGIARTEEFAWSLAGVNAHYGAPPNPRAPRRAAGGSSSGSASAVSLGQASIGLGTDTAGSIRVPAAYQGLYGIRTTHGAASTYAVLPLARSFDAVGWLTRDAGLLRRVGEVLLPPGPRNPASDLVSVPGLTGLAEPEVAAVVDAFAAEHGAMRESWDLTELPAWLAAFQTVQAWEAWHDLGAWVAPRLDEIGPEVRARFEAAALVDDEQAAAARQVVGRASARIRELVGERVVVLPSAPSVAPLLGADRSAGRQATLLLTGLAALAGLPAVGLPGRTRSGLPTGVCLLAAPGRDRDLLELAIDLT
ncbi:AtzH-like domain-containing protein [Nocardioides soli]|uniref:Asp-tRNA(Asn)/Glu-tRNA(Gln) amidotransferase A subunit family amidase n=1 Tax=Nocardioides soli TaxID=1036020 RepID=A0A7W4VUN9_9ACTN|nr:AtzH-like domain-containing protein [Nocardioides soli]MBB3041699.1 Asp-tRNA(Asn)/Glu-tRNA(Gln) amidotransferase A subunit family amidase [Nocardioides soli]